MDACLRFAGRGQHYMTFHVSFKSNALILAILRTENKVILSYHLAYSPTVLGYKVKRIPIRSLTHHFKVGRPGTV